MPPGHDPFGRRMLPQGRELTEDGGDEPFYEISNFLNRRINATTCELEYQVRWKNWGRVHQKWLPISALNNAAELLDDCDTRHPPTVEERRKFFGIFWESYYMHRKNSSIDLNVYG
ncbi:hypothetical protein K505DRAFT_367025 [Melanomma pulvis-pyrius CBS 109.77]|uniref:Chromo domain-containing protein n=1 Tax=Melanomma pulvis-pyrius CBS 109.77 TaxID=1314802 RepID=A0A6A6WV72_9PLEO|nr:hypothetical protein K505DRAFT_367025 [Melanomma pulvis-pyrius CBS 109.77]